MSRSEYRGSARMRVVGTMMVRDEVDIVAAMVEHHLAQGLDHLIVTDNASVDGTREVLEEYAAQGVIELHHDPVHRKQQHSVVTAMARRARTHFAADWVVNADADEFFVPVDKRLTLRDALEEIPVGLFAFTAEVHNMVGPPAERGAGIGRLHWRDRRSVAELNRVGIHAQPTPNALHRGDSEVVVAQGNHFVSLPSRGQPAPELEIEVYHLPWRSWSQLERKVLNAGLGYAASPDLRPSKNHHGMADYRRYLQGRLRYAYLLRTPRIEDLESGEVASFERDNWLDSHLRALTGRAVLPHQLARCLADEARDLIGPVEHADGAHLGSLFHGLEQENLALGARLAAWERRVHAMNGQIRNLKRDTRRR